jgi:hypothetical protein
LNIPRRRAASRRAPGWQDERQRHGRDDRGGERAPI